MIEVFGYIVAAILVPAALGAALVIYFRDGQKVKSIKLKPWAVDIVFTDRHNEYGVDKD